MKIIPFLILLAFTSCMRPEKIENKETPLTCEPWDGVYYNQKLNFNLNIRCGKFSINGLVNTVHDKEELGIDYSFQLKGIVIPTLLDTLNGKRIQNIRLFPEQYFKTNQDSTPLLLDSIYFGGKNIKELQIFLEYSDSIGAEQKFRASELFGNQIVFKDTAKTAPI